MPRDWMLALPSPPDDSERMPGRLRNSSAADRGAALAIASVPSELTETELSRRFWPRATAVTMMSSPVGVSASACGASACWAWAGIATISALVANRSVRQFSMSVSP